MILSEERQSHLARLISDGWWQEDLAEYADDDRALHFTKIAIAKFVKEVDEMDRSVRQKVQSLKRNVMENTPEWDVLYAKYLDEELIRRGSK